MVDSYTLHARVKVPGKPTWCCAIFHNAANQVMLFEALLYELRWSVHIGKQPAPFADTKTLVLRIILEQVGEDWTKDIKRSGTMVLWHIQRAKGLKRTWEIILPKIGESPRGVEVWAVKIQREQMNGQV